MEDVTPPPACHGLIAGWRLAAAGALPLDEPAVAQAVAAGEAGLWLHFDLLDARARTFLAALAPLPEAARAALVEAPSHVRIEEAPGALFGAIPDLHYDQDEPGGSEAGLLGFALTQGLLVTARRHPLRGVHEALRGPTAATAPEAFAGLLHATVTELGRVTAAITRRLGTIEDRMMRPAGAHRRTELAVVRRDTLRLTRHFAPLAEVGETLRDDAPEWCESPVLRREARQMLAALRILEGLAERARLAQDTLDAAVAEETNRRLFVLSVISAAMLPASLVAGIFGMNVHGVPGVAGEAEPGWGFLMAMGLILASIGGTLLSLRLARML